jgi:hypothetical protein
MEAEKTARGDWKKEESAMVIGKLNNGPAWKLERYIIQKTGSDKNEKRELRWDANRVSEMQRCSAAEEGPTEAS